MKLSISDLKKIVKEEIILENKNKIEIQNFKKINSIINENLKYLRQINYLENIKQEIILERKSSGMSGMPSGRGRNRNMNLTPSRSEKAAAKKQESLWDKIKRNWGKIALAAGAGLAGYAAYQGGYLDTPIAAIKDFGKSVYAAAPQAIKTAIDWTSDRIKELSTFASGVWKSLSEYWELFKVSNYNPLNWNLLSALTYLKDLCVTVFEKTKDFFSWAYAEISGKLSENIDYVQKTYDFLKKVINYCIETLKQGITIVSRKIDEADPELKKKAVQVLKESKAVLNSMIQTVANKLI